jgi:hypothetical protein
MLDRRHQGGADAEPARLAVDQQLLHVRPVRLVRWRGEAELDRADDTAAMACRQQDRLAAIDLLGDLLEVARRLVEPERMHEAHRGAARDAVDQHVAELVHRQRDAAGVESNDPKIVAHAARSTFDSTVESELSR